MPRKLPSPSSPTFATKVTEPGVLTPARFSTRTIATRVASPRQLSPMPGPVGTGPSRLTWTFVPSGNTVSRCAATTTCGRAPTPGREPRTFPALSMRTSARRSCSNASFIALARRVSLKGGAGISQNRIWSSVTLTSALAASSAALTSRVSESAAAVSVMFCALTLADAMVNASPNMAIVRVIMQNLHGSSIQTAGRSSNPSNAVACASTLFHAICAENSY